MIPPAVCFDTAGRFASARSRFVFFADPDIAPLEETVDSFLAFDRDDFLAMAKAP
jgi:hypothetical protein